MNREELQRRILNDDLETFVDDVVLGGVAPHFSPEQVGQVAASLAEKFSVKSTDIGAVVVGSSKLGFGLFQKKVAERRTLPAFRAIRPDSDVDLAIVSAPLYELIWDELSGYANRQATFPWNSGKLGMFMVHGWLRPDHFPKGARLRRCDDWWDLFRTLSADRRFGLRQVRGALYHSHDHLRRYQLRGLEQCRAQLESMR